MIMPFEWKMEYFSPLGYASVIAWVSVLALWFLHFVFRPKPIVSQVSLVLAFAAFTFAKVNSLTYVNKIQPDLTEQKAELEAKIAAEQQAVLDERGTQVAQIRFAEDAQDEFLDRAGLDNEDLETLDSIRDELTPDWKKGKKTRSAPSEDSEGEGMDTKAIEDSAAPEPVTMKDQDLMRANKYDYWNLQVTKWLILLGILVIIHDYLRRHNIYKEAYFPKKIPSFLANLITPHPALVHRSEKPRREVHEELAWLAERGDPFVYFTSSPEDADQAGKALQPFTGHKMRPLQVLQTRDANFTDTFAFENWWFNRASVIVNSEERPESMLQSFIELLESRKSTRARVHQTAHLVWDVESPIPNGLEQLAARTGVSIMLCRQQ
jgi:hypothetical protein